MNLRILILSIFGTFVFASCSSDSNSSNSTSQNLDPNTILPKKFLFTDADGWSEYEFFYTGNKINYIEVSGDINTDPYNPNNPSSYFFSGEIINFLYNGDLITKISSNVRGIYNEEFNFNYQNNKISSINFNSERSMDNHYIMNYNINYVYSANGNVIATKTYTDNPEILTPISINLVNNNNELVYRTSDNVGGGECNFVYETTNSPFKNIVGYSNSLSNFFFNNFASDSLLSEELYLIKYFTSFPPVYNYRSISNSDFGYLFFHNWYNEINFPINREIQIYSVYSVNSYIERCNIFYN